MSKDFSVNAPYFQELGPAAYSLGVPVEDDVVQIGMVGKYEKKRLELIIHEGIASLAREDGTTLAVETRVTKVSPKIAIFDQPIGKLVLKQTPDNADFWMPDTTDGLVIVNESGFKEFVSTIAQHAMHKKIDGEAKTI